MIGIVSRLKIFKMAGYNSDGSAGFAHPPICDEAAAEIERLTAERDGLLRWQEASLERRDLDYAEITKLRTALKPFAHAITRAEIDEPNSAENRLECCRTDITIYEFHQARAALGDNHQQQPTTEAKP